MKEKNSEMNESSKEIMGFIKKFALPVSPKFFKEIFGEKEQYCFVALQAKRLDSLINRQNNINQTSTFTKFSNTDIFWGPKIINWKYDSEDDFFPNRESVVAVLKGTSIIEGASDLWSLYETGGRRWIDIDRITTEVDNKKIQNIFKKMHKELKQDIKTGIKDFDSDLNKLNIDDIIFKLISWEGYEPDVKATLDKDRGKFIKYYFDSAYNVIRKYTKELKSLSTIKKVDGYNEVLCNKYKIIKLFFLSYDLEDAEMGMDKNIKKILKKYNTEYISSEKPEILTKKLKKYQTQGI